MTRKQGSLFSATILLIGIGFLSNVVGFLREIVIAANFGTASELGVYVIAQQIPLILFNTIYLGLPNLFVPLYHRWEKEGTILDNVREFSRLWFAISTILLVLVVLCADWLLYAFAPNLGQEDRLAGIIIMRITSIIVLFGGVFSVLRSVENAQNHFVVPSLAMFAGNILLVTMVFFGAELWGIQSLVWGTVAAVVLQTLIVGCIVRPSRLYYWGPINRRINVKKILISAFPILMLEFIFALNYSLDYSFATHFNATQVAALNYSMMLFRVPTIIIGISLGTTLLTRLSEHISNSDTEAFKEVTTNSMMLAIYVMIPVATVGYIYSEEIIRLLYQRGVFSEESVAMTSGFFRQLMPSVLAVTLYIFLSKVIATLQLNTALAMIFGGMIIVKVLLFHAIKDIAGVASLTVVITFVFFGMVLSMLWLIQRTIGVIVHRKNIIQLMTMSLGSIVSLTATAYISKFAGFFFLLTFLLLYKTAERNFLMMKLQQAFKR